MHTHLQHTAARYLLALLVFSLLFATGCKVSKSPITGKKRAYGYSWEQEVQIGKEADGQIIAQYGVYDDPELTAYVNRVADRVLAESHMRRPDTDEQFQNTEFTFRVLDSPVVNAFALPGGYIYVTRGLLTHLENEAQLAVVIGHEIGHVAARHGSQRALEGQLAQLGLIAGAVGAGVAGYDPQSVLQLGGTAAQLLFLSYGRDDERESDALGVEYAARAGYMAAEGSEFFTTLKRLSEKAGQTLPSFLSSHPDPGEREQTIVELAAQYEDQYAMDMVGQNDLYREINNVVYGENPRQGFVQNGVFYHPDLRFAFPVPAGWVTVNSASQVQVIKEDQSAGIIFTFAQDANSAQQAGQTFASQEGITARRSGATQVNGNPAYVVEATAQSQQGAYGLLVYFIEYGGNVYQFLGVTSEQQYASNARTFEQSMQGFRRLTDSRILNIQPIRLQIQGAQRSAQFEALVPRNLPDPITAQDLAIINQVQLNTPIQQGASLKFVGR